MKTTRNAFIMRLLGVIMFSFIVGSFVKTAEHREGDVFLKIMNVVKDITASAVVPSTINSEVVFIKVVPSYTAKASIASQMNMSNNILYGYAVSANSSDRSFNFLTGRLTDPPSIDPESG
jgi:hypothetical protein